MGGYHHEKGHVIESSAEAAVYGVTPGVSLRQAYTLCPDGVFLPYREECCTEAFSLVRSHLVQLCPLVEPSPPSHFLLGLRYEREERRFAVEVSAAVEGETGFRMSCGIASSRFVACLAAEDAGLSQVLLVPAGAERDFLRGLPLERLPVTAPTLRRLRLFGIARIGELRLLPAGALEAQFGIEGRRLLELATGVDDARVQPWRDDAMVVAERSFDIPVEDGGELLEVVGEMLDCVCGDLEARWQACRRLTLAARFENGEMLREELRFKEATASREVLKRRVTACIERLSGAAPVSMLRLEAADLGAGSGRQTSFLDGPRRSTPQLRDAVRALQLRYGKDAVKRIVVRAGGRRPEEAFSFTACDPEVT
jgi:DNA polymerase-4